MFFWQKICVARVTPHATLAFIMPDSSAIPTTQLGFAMNAAILKSSETVKIAFAFRTINNG
jgi:hypothetical protein